MSIRETTGQRWPLLAALRRDRLGCALAALPTTHAKRYVMDSEAGRIVIREFVIGKVAPGFISCRMVDLAFLAMKS